MKETPILFTGDMVRAVLDGRKTQTRRVAPVSELNIEEMKNGLVAWSIFFEKPQRGAIASLSGGPFTREDVVKIIGNNFCPYGKVGNRLWVKETFYATSKVKNVSCRTYYRADCDQLKEDMISVKWSPSIFMPRWLSRITLQITNIRVERLQDISRGDAMAEGCPFQNMAGGENPVHWYAALWDSINGKAPKKCWSANPWVWVIEFRRIEL